MTWLYTHIVNVGFWMQTLIGIYTVYIGVQISRRRNWESRMKLTRSELVIAMLLLIVGCFLLGVHAVERWV